MLAVTGPSLSLLSLIHSWFCPLTVWLCSLGFAHWQYNFTAWARPVSVQLKLYVITRCVRETYPACQFGTRKQSDHPCRSLGGPILNDSWARKSSRFTHAEAALKHFSISVYFTSLPFNEDHRLWWPEFFRRVPLIYLWEFKLAHPLNTWPLEIMPSLDNSRH